MRFRALHRLTALASVALAGCQGLADALAPGREGTLAPARVALLTTLPAARGAATVELGVAGTYLRRDGSSARLMERAMPLTNAKEQAVPVAVDLATCLADGQRSAGPDGRGCKVTLTLALVVDGVTVDRQVIGPMLLQPGATASVDEPVSLFEIASMELRGPAGEALADDASLGTVVGGTMALRATIRDRAGVAVAERAVTWASSAPAIATVDQAGNVTALAAGSARITATNGPATRGVNVRVLRAPIEVTVRAGTGAGAGRILSIPAGIDCTLAGGAGRGTCTSRFAADSVVRLVAIPDAGSRFGAWGASCTGAQSNCQVVVDAAREVTAGFLALRRIQVTGSGDGRGQVVGSGLDCRIDGDEATGTCGVSAAEGERIVVRAIPASATNAEAEARFASWTGACAADVESCTVTLGASDVALAAAFHAPRWVTVELDGDGDGRIEGDRVSCAGNGVAATGTCRVSVPHGTSLTLRASVATTSRFNGWAGACVRAGESASCEITADRAVLVRAVFAAGRELFVEAGAGDGEGRVVGPNGLDCVVRGATTTGTCRVLFPGEQASLVATAATSPRRQSFSGWDGACTGTATTCVVRLTSGRSTVRPRFHDEQRLVLNVGGAGAGQVTAPSVSLACALAVGGRVSGVCAASEPWGTTVTLQATPDARSAFAGWGGECQSVSGLTCVARLTAARRVTATFIPRQVALTLQGTGDGEGTILVDGQPACTLVAGAMQASCVTQVDVGSVVTLSANTAVSSTFSGFRGACMGPSSCQLTMDAPQTVTAPFALRRFVLTTTSSGTGGGTTSINGAPFCTLVAGAPPKVCTMSVAWGTLLQVANTPAVGNVLAALGGACSLGAPCTVRVGGDVQLSPRFEPGLRVELVPGGTGNGSLSAMGLTCTVVNGTVSGSCVGYVLPGAQVSVVALPDASSQLQGWLGGCKATVGATCAITITEPQRLAARFAPVP